MIDSRKKRGKGNTTTQADDAGDSMNTSLFAEDKTTKTKANVTRPRLTHAQLRELEVEKEKEVVRGYRRQKELWPAVVANDPEAERVWLVEAEKLVDMFCETRNLFLTSRVRADKCPGWLSLC